MTTQDKKFNQALNEQMKHGILIQRDTNAEIIRLLKIAQDQVKVILASQPTDYQLWQLPQIQRDISRVLADFGDKGSVAISSGASSSWVAGQASVDVPIAAGGIVIAAQLPRIDTQQLEALRYFMTDRIKDIGNAAINKINQELGLVVIGVNNPSDAIGRVQDVLGDISRQRATTIVRTEVGRVFEIASHERKLQAAEMLPGLKKQWRRSGKVHSRMSHDAIDGQIRDVNKPFVIQGKSGPVKMRYPRDPKAPAGETINCGCISLSYMAHWDMVTPGRKAFTEQEILLNPTKRDISQGQSLNQLLGQP